MPQCLRTLAWPARPALAQISRHIATGQDLFSTTPFRDRDSDSWTEGLLSMAPQNQGWNGFPVRRRLFGILIWHVMYDGLWKPR